jgi:hypothetical protein
MVSRAASHLAQHLALTIVVPEVKTNPGSGRSHTLDGHAIV